MRHDKDTRILPLFNFGALVSLVVVVVVAVDVVVVVCRNEEEFHPWSTIVSAVTASLAEV